MYSLRSSSSARLESMAKKTMCSMNLSTHWHVYIHQEKAKQKQVNIQRCCIISHEHSLIWDVEHETCLNKIIKKKHVNANKQSMWFSVAIVFGTPRLKKLTEKQRGSDLSQQLHLNWGCCNICWRIKEVDLAGLVRNKNDWSFDSLVSEIQLRNVWRLKKVTKW